MSMTAEEAAALGYAPARLLVTREPGPREEWIYVHREEKCADDPTPCTLHRPTNHGMRDWPLVLRLEKNGTFWRQCPHGLVHPDPDSMEFLLANTPPEFVDGVIEHSCDDCCGVAYGE